MNRKLFLLLGVGMMCVMLWGQVVSCEEQQQQEEEEQPFLPLWGWILAYLVMCGVTLVFLQWLATSAALRGQKGKPMPDFVQRLLRAIFFFVVFSPLIFLATAIRREYGAVIIALLLAYLVTYLDLSEIRGGRPSTWFQGLFILRWFKSYLILQMETEIEEKLKDDGTSYLFCVHPHGILPFGSILNLTTPVNQFAEKVGNVRLRGLAASFCFYIPFYRDLVLAGGVCDAGRYSAQKLFDNGYSIFVVPGGATEALHSLPDEDILYLKARKGFIKLALQKGAHLVPVFSYNENNQYEQFNNRSPSVMWVKKKFQAIFGISLPLLKNLIPKRCEITTIIGKPMKLERDPDPSDEKIQQTLDEYCQYLTAMYERNSKYNKPAGKKLTII